jgi:predicted transcriptional regulator
MFIYLSNKNTIISDDRLIIPCEIAVKSVVPAVKALIAKELVEKHGLKQDEVAELLGISQSAVSKYTRKVRGYIIKIDELEELKPLTEKMIDLIVDGSYDRTEFLEAFCQICMVVRKVGLICQFCQPLDTGVKVEQCNFCKSVFNSTENEARSP